MSEWQTSCLTVSEVLLAAVYRFLLYFYYLCLSAHGVKFR